MTRPMHSTSVLAVEVLSSPETTWRPRRITPRRTLRSRLRRS
ncbi:MAG TPA: hypothetical protein VEV13_02765 [Candidatus Limnocylindria bacterium]|nr:hypothetical protein [Candidatus Limnocylindria bacterium]